MRDYLTMADISIPPPDANGYWHFTYITSDSETGQWYGGKRSTKKHPLSDRYLGSSVWVKKHPERKRLKREIVEFYATSADVFAAEMALITWDEVLNDPLCMNETEGGVGLTVEGILRLHADAAFRDAYTAGIARRSANPEWRKSLLEAWARKSQAPEWRDYVTTRNQRICSSPEWRTNNLAHLKRVHANPEVGAKISRTRTGVRKTAEARETNAAHLQRINSDPEVNAKRGATSRRLWADPEYHAMMCEARLRGWATRRANALKIEAVQSAIIDEPLPSEHRP
jgi:hypothetical protein